MLQISSGFGHKLIIYTDELPNWISPSSNLEESIVSLGLLPNASDNFSVMQETNTCTEEFLDCISELCCLEESTVSLSLLPNMSRDSLEMHESNIDIEEFLDCNTESSYLEESVVSLHLLPNVSHDSLQMHETSSDTEEFPDCISESSYSDESRLPYLGLLSHNIWGLHENKTYQCHSEDSIVLSFDLLSHNIWGLHETKTHPEEFPEGITKSSYIPESKLFSDLLPNASHNFLGMILCFKPDSNSITYTVKSTTSDLMYNSEDFNLSSDLVMVVVPRSIFAVTDGDNRIEITSDFEIIVGIHSLYKSENKLVSDTN